MYYDWFLMCWQNGTVTYDQLLMAVQYGYITEEERKTIVGEV
jgi:hypothetical protein